METLEGTRKTNYALVITKLASTLNQHNNNNNQYRKIIITEWQKEKDPVKEYPRKKLNSVFFFFFFHNLSFYTCSGHCHKFICKTRLMTEGWYSLKLCSSSFICHNLPDNPTQLFIVITSIYLLYPNTSKLQIHPISQ